MRKVLILLLSLCIAFSFLACGKEHSAETSKHHFYYLRSDILYGAEDGVISCEYRERDNTDGETLLKQYLLGPISEDLVSPYPAGTALDSIKLYDDSLLIFLNKEFAQQAIWSTPWPAPALPKPVFQFSMFLSSPYVLQVPTSP